MSDKINKIKAGDLMAVTHYVKVDNRFGTTMQVTDVDRNLSFRVEGADLLESCASADLFETEKKVTKTEAAEILTTSYGRPLTVCFTKQKDGKNRVLRGRLVTPEPLLGRSKVEDLDIQSGMRMRLVDHRTIRYLVVDGVKYTVKK